MLPFVQPPAVLSTRQIGNKRSGILELTVRGGLTVGETATIKELVINQASSFLLGAKAADVIAKAENISLVEAFQIIEDACAGRVLEDAANAIRLRHAELIQDVALNLSSAGQLSMEATVTALIRSRLNLPEWSMEDTRTLDQALFEGIWQLAQDEQATEDLPTNPPTEEELGKRQPAPTGSRKPTGRRSSGS